MRHRAQRHSLAAGAADRQGTAAGAAAGGATNAAASGGVACLPVPWPLPALLAWALCWIAFAALRGLDAPLAIALTLATLLGLTLAAAATMPWRRVFVAAGFPLSLAAAGVVAVPAWAWLAPLAALALVYPIGAWRDAPLFPTPRGALRGLAAHLALPDGARVLDAGCGLGDGLIELRRELPDARFSGLEWSWPLRLAAAWRCRFADIRRGDIWAADWSSFDLVYVFQRPESMADAVAKAARELRPGAWLVSLEFEAPDLLAQHRLQASGAKPVWLYQAPFEAA